MRAMPFSTSVATFVNATAWTVYAAVVVRAPRPPLWLLRLAHPRAAQLRPAPSPSLTPVAAPGSFRTHPAAPTIPPAPAQSGDPFVLVPNVLGMAAGSVQLALFARFGVYRGPPKAEDTIV